MFLFSPPLSPFKVDDDGNDSDGDGDGDGDDAAAATDGNDVEDDDRGILNTAIGGGERLGRQQHNATTNRTRGVQREAEA